MRHRFRMFCMDQSDITVHGCHSPLCDPAQLCCAGQARGRRTPQSQGTARSVTRMRQQRGHCRGAHRTELA